MHPDDYLGSDGEFTDDEDESVETDQIYDIEGVPGTALNFVYIYMYIHCANYHSFTDH